tara:strand:+ start:3362 stop:3628 length:267 start_codon:yes stop_codon:yes gene_type:complete
MSEFKPSTQLVECLPCEKRKPPVIKWAALLIPVRELPYSMVKETASIDKRLMGVCIECIETLTEFQQDIKQHRPVDVDNKDLVYRLDE